MTVEQQFKCKAIFNRYGGNHQLRICQEECAELIQAVSKYLRAKEEGKTTLPTFTALMEELADVLIMSEQVSLMFDRQALSVMIERKLTRQLDRMAER